jgi:hypothetical protein
MRPALLLAALLGFTLACSGAPASQASSPDEVDSAGAGADTRAGAEASPTDAPPTQPLTRDDCAELIVHIVDLAVREDAAENPDLPPPTDEELAAMQAQLRDELEDRCVGRDRGIYDCAMRAHSRAELTACDDPAT